MQENQRITRRGGGKNPLREFYYDYKDEIIFGLVLSVVVIVSNMLTPLIPVNMFHSIILPTPYTMIITLCGGSAYLLWRHHEGKRMRKIMAGIMLAWTLITVGGLIARYRSDAPEIADGIFSLQGWEFVLGDILAWMLMVYPAEFLRPGWLTWKKAFAQLAPVVLVGALDWWLDIDLRWLLAIYPLYILFMLFRHVHVYREWCEANFASMDDIDFQWVVRYLIMVFIVGCSFAYMCFSNVPTYAFTQMWLLFFLLFYSTEKIFFRPDPWEKIKEEERELSKASIAASTSDAETQLPAPDSSSNRARLDEWMEKEKPYLNKDFRLTDLMQVLPMNRTYLSQFIMTEYGCNFYQFVANYRIEEAKRLMREYPDMKIQDIAEQSGFSSPVVFSRTFVRETGITPSEWESDIDNS
ncbi:MAG: AraC family transcriptional regulator [Paludibacteraceae bacterium]|nr:AraC family transcriptional regulator [Paludibacteraceae bacterium]